MGNLNSRKGIRKGIIKAYRKVYFKKRLFRKFDVTLYSKSEAKLKSF